MGGGAARKGPQVPSPVTCAAMGTCPTAPGSHAARRKGLIINCTRAAVSGTTGTAHTGRASGAGRAHGPGPTRPGSACPKGIHRPGTAGRRSPPRAGCCGASPAPRPCHGASPALRPCHGPGAMLLRQRAAARPHHSQWGSMVGGLCRSAPCPAGQGVGPHHPPGSRGPLPAAALTLWKAEETMWWISEDTWEWVMAPAWRPGAAGLALLLLAGAQGMVSGQHNLGAERGGQGHGHCSPPAATTPRGTRGCPLSPSPGTGCHRHPRGRAMSPLGLGVAPPRLPRGAGGRHGQGWPRGRLRAGLSWLPAGAGERGPRQTPGGERSWGSGTGPGPLGGTPGTRPAPRGAGRQPDPGGHQQRLPPTPTDTQRLTPPPSPASPRPPLPGPPHPPASHLRPTLAPRRLPGHQADPPSAGVLGLLLWETAPRDGGDQGGW